MKVKNKENFLEEEIKELRYLLENEA